MNACVPCLKGLMEGVQFLNTSAPMAKNVLSAGRKGCTGGGGRGVKLSVPMNVERLSLMAKG